MRKATKAGGKKPISKKLTAKKSPTKPQRKAQDQSEMTQVVARLDAIVQKLSVAVDRLNELSARQSHPEERLGDPQRDSILNQHETTDEPPDFTAAPITGEELVDDNGEE